MPRPPRIQLAGGVFHVTARGVARQGIFRGDEDRRLFLATLGSVVRRHDWNCHAFCLMTTHYHLLIRTPNPDLARGMQLLNGVYAQTFNRRHEEVGHRFESRYHSVLIEREAHLLELCRYFALNPVRAGACTDPARWPWSSYPAVLGLAPAPWFLSADWLLAHFGTDRARARQRLREFVLDSNEVAGNDTAGPRPR